MPSMLLSRFRSSTTASMSRVVTVAGGVRRALGKADLFASGILLFNVELRGGILNQRGRLRGRRTPAAVSSRTSSLSSVKIWSRILVPSRMRCGHALLAFILHSAMQEKIIAYAKNGKA